MKLIHKILIATGIIGIAYAAGIEVSSPVAEVPHSKLQAALVKNGVVINSVVLPLGWPNVKNAWQAPSETQVIFSDKAGVTDIYDGKDFYKIKDLISTATPAENP